MSDTIFGVRAIDCRIELNKITQRARHEMRNIARLSRGSPEWHEANARFESILAEIDALELKFFGPPHAHLPGPDAT